MILNFTRVETHQHLTTTSTIHMRRRTLKGKRVRKNSREVLYFLMRTLSNHYGAFPLLMSDVTSP